MQLSRADLASVLDFVGDVAGLESDEAYAPEFLSRLQDLVRCEVSQYQEFEYRARRSYFFLAFGPSGPYRWGSATELPEPDADDELYWSLGPCPIVHYRIRERDLVAIRMSDVTPTGRFRELPIYREYFGPSDIDYMLDLGLPERSQRQRSLLLFRRKGETDFSERDRAVLEALRPHLYHLETHAFLRRKLAEALRTQNADGDSSAYAELTPREREIVKLVAQGKTNAEIATELWVAPSTVKKHLEHIYEKLGVGRRAAAAMLVRSAG
jgi:DNA-binding CsgD family transcriptional regulator